MQPMLNIAIRAAHRAGDFIVRKINKLPDLQVEVKARNDFVSEVDREAEARIIEDLLKSYPDHGIVAEESGQIEGKGEYRWIIDAWRMALFTIRSNRNCSPPAAATAPP
jgi:myo-inositol-1(or 4)-monophosphatase